MKTFTARALLSLILLLSIIAGLPGTGYAQAASETARVAPDQALALATIELKVDARRKELGIPGIALVIVKDDKIIYIKGLGYKDFEKKIAVTPDTQFAIGSATKAFTALSVLMSQDEGKLSIDDSPKKYLPYFKMYDPETDKNILIRDLLCHSSGLNRTDLAMMTGKLDRRELIEVAAQAKPTAKLREKFQYQNIMFTAVGEIASVVQKQPYDKLIEDRIFKPLGMTNSTMSMKQMEKVSDFSYGYSYNPDTKETRKLPFRDIDQIAPAGSINSSARDMAEWVRFVLNGGTVGGKRLVSESGYKEWLKPQMRVSGASSYGFGWFLDDWNGLKVVQHGGNIDGFNSQVAMIPEKKIGFVLLTNVSASSLGAELMPVVWKELLGDVKPSEDPKSVTTAVAPAATTNTGAAKELIGKYESDLNGRIAEIKELDGNVALVIGSQPPFTLTERSKDIYNMSPLPEAYFVTVKRDPAGKISRFTVTQPEGEFSFKSLAYSGNSGITITTAELSQKAIDVIGGAANWRKLTSRVVTYETDMLNQGLRASGTSYAKAPNKTASASALTALGKPVGKGWEFFDGVGGSDALNFVPYEVYTGKRLADVKLGADFYGMLDWESKYKKIEITRITKVGDEDCYAVIFTPNEGSKFTEYYSTKTFLLLKRDGTIPVNGVGELPYSIFYSDYRDIDGVKLAYKTTSQNISNGEVVTTITSVKHNVKIDDKFFAPRKL